MKYLYNVLCILFLSILPGLPAGAQIIKTVAGIGELYYIEEGGLATDAMLGSVGTVVADLKGNYFIATGFTKKVYKIDPAGIITTVAGTGTKGNSKDGIPATSAELFMADDIALDRAGNLYIADYTKIRKVDLSGIITTVAGTGLQGYSGDGGPATSAEINTPAGLAIDASGNIFFADRENHVIRKIDASGFITTIAGTGTKGFSGENSPAASAQLNYPTGLALDASANLFITDQGNHIIRKIDNAGIISTLAGSQTSGFSGDGQDALMARFSAPAGITLDASGNLYVADVGNERIRKIDASGLISTVAGNGEQGFNGDGGEATSAKLYGPNDVAIDAAGNLLIADRNNYRIRKINTAGYIITVAGTGSEGYSEGLGKATAAQLYYPQDIAFDPSGNMYVAEYNNNRIRKIDPFGGISTVAGTGEPGFSGDGGAAVDAMLYNPSGVVADGAGNLYIADNNNYRIRKIDASGIITTVAGTGTKSFGGDGGAAVSAYLSGPTDVAMDASGNLYIADPENHRIRMLDTEGIISTVAGNGTKGFSGDGGPATAASFNFPYAVTVDGSGNLFIVDRFNNRIRKVDTSGKITTVAGSGTQGFSGDGSAATSAFLSNPSGVATDGKGNLYISDDWNHRIRKVGASGIITTVAGTGVWGDGGDGGQAIAAQLPHPSAVLSDPFGNVYIADRNNNRIRMITGYSVAFDQKIINKAVASSSVSFSYSGTVPGENFDYDFSVSGEGESAPVTGKDSFPSPKEKVSGIDVSTLEDGVLVLSLTLKNTEGFTGRVVTATTFKETILPTALTKDYTLVLDDFGKGIISEKTIDDGSFDSNGSVTLSLDKLSFSCADLGENTVILSVTDEAGNKATATASVTVEDHTAPAFFCPSDVTAENGVLPSLSLREVKDNCGAPQISYELTGATTAAGSGDLNQESFNEGVTVVTYTVADKSGNSKSCSFQLTYSGPEPGLSQKDDNKILLYPNPAGNGVVSLDLTGVKGVVQVKITDLAGKQPYSVHQLSPAPQQAKLDVSSLPGGIYFVQLEGSFGSKAMKLVIQK